MSILTLQISDMKYTSNFHSEESKVEFHSKIVQPHITSGIALYNTGITVTPLNTQGCERLDAMSETKTFTKSLRDRDEAYKNVPRQDRDNLKQSLSSHNLNALSSWLLHKFIQNTCHMRVI